MEKDFFTELLRRELIVAMGCTEPAAAALAGAAAYRAFAREPEEVLIRASRDIIKNAMNVGLPNTCLRGIGAAVALGIAGGDTEKGLSILSGIDRGWEAKAKALLDSGRLRLELAERTPPVFIEVRLRAGEQSLSALIRNVHTEVTIRKNGKASAAEPPATDPAAKQPGEAGQFTLEDIFAYVDSVPLGDIAFLAEAAKTNLNLALHSVKTGYGIQVGKTMFGEGREMDYPEQGAALAAAASDARMAGCSMPVVINSGSGNQGITISVPLLVLARGIGSSEEELLRALALANLTALMVTSHKGRLSALCGAFTAAMGTAAGYVKLLGPRLGKGGYADEYGAVGRSINIMTGNLMGIVCDGAKGSCALKIYSCVQAAAMSAKLALAGRTVPDHEGLPGSSPEDTMGVLEEISHEGMVPLDKSILKIMLERKNQQARRKH
ncbi:MAG: L-serine ammonia-lyase, iron-sulfur-dependent, subunit alpha [Treponema sp.]|nr:L-serine ammonia-lyase, iron-sulfur-dependent, subunit alpha [Treponema sp.]